ncbi:hypothetical protein STPL106120_04250 [Streptococcus pluranimalium]|uniref:DnaD domain protein n=1 Tax=Streptococcus pluranimalium TaxID=82348 RepID=UPI0039EC934F
MAKKNSKMELAPTGKLRVQYQNDFPEMFTFGDMKRSEEALVSGLLSLVGKEMRFKKDYNPDEEIYISYEDLAKISGGELIRSYQDKKVQKTYYYINEVELRALVENLQEKAKSVSYTPPIKDKGEEIGYKDYPLFSMYTVNHKERFLGVKLNNQIFQKEILDEAGQIVQPQRRVYELFRQDNWTEHRIPYLYYNPRFHNLLSSKYSMRLYRALADFRKSTFYRIKADDFVERVMVLDTANKKKKKNVYIKTAFEELQSARDQYDNPIFPELELEIEKKGNKTVRYYFTFKPFSNDMLYVVGKDEEGRFILDFEHQKTDGSDDSEEFLEVLEVFHTVFSTDSQVDNKNNRSTLKKWLEQVDKDVIMELIKRTGYDSSRKFGWTIKAMENILANGVKTLEDLKTFDEQKFNPGSQIANTMISEDDSFKEVIKLLKNLLNTEKISPIILEDAQTFVTKESLSPKVIAYAIKEAIFIGDSSKSNWQYVRGILENLINNDIKTDKQLDMYINNQKTIDPQTITVSDEFQKAMTIWQSESKE